MAGRRAPGEEGEGEKEMEKEKKKEKEKERKKRDLLKKGKGRNWYIKRN